MKKLTTKDIILSYIKMYAPVVISNVEMQIKMVDFGKRFNVYHTPETYVREWRKIKRQNIPNIEFKLVNDKGDYLCTISK